MKSLFEQMGGTYMLQGDYYLPNLTLPAEENKPMGYQSNGIYGISGSIGKYFARICSQATT